MTSELLRQLNSLAAVIRKGTAVNVNSQGVRAAAIEAGSYYFKDFRAVAKEIITDEKVLASFDQDWQDLIRLAHGNNARASYLKLLAGLLRKTKDITVESHLSPSKTISLKKPAISHSEAEKILIATLEKMIPTASSSYQQGLRDLLEDPPRLSYRGAASELREALRETLDLLAPDAEVVKQSWFKQETNTHGPTMRQKVRFILAAREKTKAQQDVSVRSIELIEGLCGNVARAVYTSASLSAHVQTTKQEVHQMKRYLDAVLFDILEITSS